MYRAVLATDVGSKLHDAAIELCEILVNIKSCQNLEEAVSVYIAFLRRQSKLALTEDEAITNAR